MPDEKNMFESLRLSAGGGLNTSMEKVAQDENTATIAIGLGGTGVSALRMFKKTVFERVMQDNYDKRDIEVPQYNKIRFLAIDSDRKQISSPLPQTDFSNEFFYVGVSDIIAELADKVSLKNKKYLDWFNTEIEMTNASNGAGGIRQVGKYLLSKKANELYNKFTDMIRTAITGLDKNFALNIYIMAGIGGGTGSGCFVDVCYIMQKALTDLGYAGSANVLGFFFLPDVNLSNPDFPKGGPHETLLKKNGYAALKELDYLMDIANNGDTYKQQYSDTFGVNLSVAPVKMCHLLSTTDIDGRVIKDGYNYVMNVVAEYALNFVVKSEEVDPDGATSGITVQGIQSNITALLQTIYKNYGSSYVYNILGASCATVPYKQIGTYLAIKFFDSIKYIADMRPTNGDVEQFCKNIGLDFLSLDMEVKKGTKPLNLDPKRFDTNAIKGFSIGTISEAVASVCNNWKQETANARTSNIKTLSRKLDEYVTTDKPESIIGRIFKELISYTANTELGPHFAAYMIQNSQSHTIASVLAGIREQAKKKRDYAQSQSGFRMDEMQGAQTEFNTANFMNVNSKKQKYLFEVENWYKNQVEIETYNDYITMIDKVLKHLDALEEEYFKKLTNIIDKLILTFKDNAEYFNNHGMGNEMYTWSIVEIDSIKDQLDEIIEKALKKDNDEVTAPYFVEKFTKLMLSHMNMWFDENETKIAELISNFIREEFKEAMSKSMKQYLQEKYNRTGADLIDCIANHVIKEGIVAKGTPVFHVDVQMFPISNDAKNHAEYIVLSIPNNEEDISEAAVKYKINSGKQMGISKNVLTDRIFMLQFFSGIPMYAYKDLIELERVYYDNINSPGVHMFESEDKNWKRLPSPIPASYETAYYTRVEQNRVDSILKLYNDAAKVGIIKEDVETKSAKLYRSEAIDLAVVLGSVLSSDAVSELNKIYSLPEGERADYIADICKRKIWPASLADTSNASGVMADFIHNYPSRLENPVKLVPTSEFERTVRDDFARKPIYVAVAQAEYEKHVYVNTIVEILETIKKNLDSTKNVTADFIRALLHSVIVKKRSNFVFSFEKRGEVEDIILTEANEQYEDIPVYRAFVNYTNLSEEVLEQISEKTKAAARNVTDEIFEAAKAFQSFYKDIYKDYKSAAASGNFDNKDEITSFLEELYDSIDSFIRNNQ